MNYSATQARGELLMFKDLYDEYRYVKGNDSLKGEKLFLQGAAISFDTPFKILMASETKPTKLATAYSYCMINLNLAKGQLNTMEGTTY